MIATGRTTGSTGYTTGQSSSVTGSLAGLTNAAGAKIAGPIQNASAKTGVDFSYLLQQAKIESSFYQENAYHFTDKYGNPLGYSAKNYNSGYVTDSTYIVVTNDDNKINVLLNESSFADKYAVNGEIIKIQIKSGLIALSRNGLQGVVNYQNKPVLPFEKREIKEITEKLIISEERGKYYLYDNSGHQIFKDGFDYFRDYENNGFRAVANKIEGKTYEYITPECLTGKPDTIIKNHRWQGRPRRSG